jgi:hypothetical protein
MAEATQYLLSFKELAEIVVKKQGLHEGFWGIIVKFGIQAANLNLPGGASLFPSAIVPILEIGIQKQDELTPLAVDAAIVNPRPLKGKKRSPK